MNTEDKNPTRAGDGPAGSEPFSESLWSGEMLLEDHALGALEEVGAVRGQLERLGKQLELLADRLGVAEDVLTQAFSERGGA